MSATERHTSSVNSRQYKYTLADLALLCDVSRSMIYNDMREGLFDPYDLLSVTTYVQWRNLKKLVESRRNS